MIPRKYVYRLAFDARYRAEFDVDRGKVSSFVVQLEWLSGEDWIPVVRYDTAHGFAHRDRYFVDGTKSQHEPLSAADFNKALTLAITDVQTNWRDWVRPFRESCHE